MADQPENPGEPKTLSLTQEALDKIISDRLAQQDRVIRAEFADYDDLKQAKTKLEELEQANETEAERRVREAREEASKGVDAKVQSATAAARAALVDSAIRMAAVTQGFKYPDDVAAKLAGHKDITIGDDFKVKGVDKLVEQLAKDRPEWLAATRQPFNGAPPRTGATPPPPGAPPPGSPEAVSAEQHAFAHRRQALGIQGTVL